VPEGIKQNRLAKEKSPYLRQHAHNPVDWYTWGDEAFEKALSENKPIFLSIGYSTCHWCHVMERESFANTEVARLMNKTFVSIKVDREERPDIDSYYMTVCQLITGTGGWPLTIIMSPEKEAFFATTYLPRENKFGRVGLLQLIPKIDAMWRSRKDEILESASQITELAQRITVVNGGGELDEEIIRKAYRMLGEVYDESAGGFGNAPKFPTPQNLSFLLRYWQRTKKDRARKMAEHTLRSMRMGGIYDHIGYGFHRYSTDALWRLPHFEKMLYDQAMLLIAYTEAFQVTRQPLYETTVREIVRYVLRDMNSNEGGFYSAEDADSEGTEGKYYVWTEDEIRRILTPAEAEIAVKIFNVKRDDDSKDEASQESTGSNILYVTKREDDLAKESGMSVEEYKAQLASLRGKMLGIRRTRPHPHKDKKILSDWNGLMIAALSKAARILDNGEYLDKARSCAHFMLTNMMDAQGALYHRYIDGDRAVSGFLDDYVFLVWGLIELYEAGFEPAYLRAALELNEKAIELFWDRDAHGFFSTTEDSELPVRKKDIYDGALPSGNAVAVSNLLRLSRLTGRTELEKKAMEVLRLFAENVRENPVNYLHMLAGLHLLLFPEPDIVISGNKTDDTTIEMLRIINASASLDTSVIVRPIEHASEVTAIAPFTKKLLPLNGKTTAYICRDYACEKPINDIAILKEILPPIENLTRG